MTQARKLFELEARGGFTPLWNEESYADELSHPSSRLHEMRGGAEGELVGFVLYRIEDREGWIMQLAVAEKGRGHGKRLLGECLARMRAEGLESAWLEVSLKNLAALRLYKALGFKETGIRKAYYRNGDDAAVMHLLFGSAG